MNDPLLVSLDNAINGQNPTMPDLNLTVIPASDLLGEFVNRPTVYGIRKLLPNDYDPRTGSDALPFPTYCGTVRDVNDNVLNNRKCKNYLFYDDLHFTDISNKKISDFVLKHLQNFTNAPQAQLLRKLV